MTGAIGGSIVGCGLLTCLVIADMPLAVAAAAAFGMLGLLGAWGRLRGWRSRPPGFRPGAPRDRLRAAVARPRWTDDDRAWLESAGFVLPGKRGRGR